MLIFSFSTGYKIHCSLLYSCYLKIANQSFCSEQYVNSLIQPADEKMYHAQFWRPSIPLAGLSRVRKRRGQVRTSEEPYYELVRSIVVD